MLDGEIRVESETDKGSTFYVDIPNNLGSAVPTPCEIPSQTQTKPKIPTGLKVIVAEDDKISFFFLNYILEGISAKILHATNGMKAIELVKENPDTDIVLMDSKMPVLNGIDAVKEIRKFNPDVYIIAQTAYAIDDYKSKTLEAGCNNYIEKPVNKDKLLEIISEGITKTN